MNPANAIDQILRQMWPGQPVSVRMVDDFVMGAFVITLTNYGAFPVTEVERRLSRYEIEAFQSHEQAMGRIVGLLVEMGQQLGLGRPFTDSPEPQVEPVVVKPKPAVKPARTRLIELE